MEPGSGCRSQKIWWRPLADESPSNLLPISELPHIFEPFYRTTAVTASNIHGTGLGLSITKNLVEATGGRITVESSPGEGTAFTIHLEIAPASAQKSAPGSNA